MSGIPGSSRELGPDAQRLLAYLKDHPNQQFTLEQLADALDSTVEQTQVWLEALDYQGEIEKQHPEGGEPVYTRPRQT